MPEVSIVVRTFNEEKHLPALLTSIKNQTYRDSEIVVVDSGSFDSTCEIAERLADRLVHINSQDFTFGYSLNTGIDAAEGKLIAVVSAHTLPTDTKWLEQLIMPFRDERTAMTFGRQFGAPKSKFGEVQDLRRTYGSAPQRLHPNKIFANNANSALRKELWAKHKFDETLLGLEDAEWAKYWMERGYHVDYEPSAGIYHIHEESWPQVRHRYFREAAAARNIGLLRKTAVVSTLWSESRNLFADLIAACRKGKLTNQLGQIVRFRFYKTLGTMSGLMDKNVMKSQAKRDIVFFDRTHKAVVLTGPRRASLENVQSPIIKPGDVLLKVAFEGVSPSDVMTLEDSWPESSTRKGQYPVVPGHEVSGKVVRVGTNVSHVLEGDPATIQRFQSCGKCEACRARNEPRCPGQLELGTHPLSGGYAQFIVAQGRFVHKLPDHTDLRAGALIDPLATALKAERRLNSVGTQEGSRDLTVLGSGPLGQLITMLLSIRGHRVTVFDPDQHRKSRFNVQSVVTSTDPKSSVEGREAIFDTIGDPMMLGKIMPHLASGSKLLLVGDNHIGKKINPFELEARDITISIVLGSDADDYQAATALLPELDMNPFTQRVIPLSKFQNAWSETKEKKHLKILLEVDGTLNGSF